MMNVLKLLLIAPALLGAAVAVALAPGRSSDPALPVADPDAARAALQRQEERERGPYRIDALPLGTTVSAFRRLDFLPETARRGRTAICSDEPAGAVLPAIRPNSADRPGAVRCGVFGPRGEGDQPPPVVLEFFGEPFLPAFVFYRAKDDAEPRLAVLSLSTRNERFPVVLDLLRRSYGLPINYEMSRWSSVNGLPVTNATYHWSNGVSSIRLDMLSFELDRLSINFLYDALWDALVARGAGIED